MSKLAKKPIIVPAGVTATIEADAVAVTGPKGELRVRIPAHVKFSTTEQGLMAKGEGESKQVRANTGTAWSLVRNAVLGVTAGYAKVLEIEGVGYKMAIEGNTVALSIGRVHPVRLEIPKGITATLDKSGLTIAGIDKELVGRFAAEIRAQKKPEPYKGKGIRYAGEVIRRKVGKKAATAGG